MLRVHLVNASTQSFDVAVITPRWLYLLAAATRHVDDVGVLDAVGQFARSREHPLSRHSMSRWL